MSDIDEITKALREAGQQLKGALWKPEDELFLRARAEDLARLSRKALATTNPAKKKGYQAAAQDVIHHVQAMALIRAEAATSQLLETLGKVFMDHVLPALIKLIPALLVA